MKTIRTQKLDAYSHKFHMRSNISSAILCSNIWIHNLQVIKLCKNYHKNQMYQGSLKFSFHRLGLEQFAYILSSRRIISEKVGRTTGCGFQHSSINLQKWPYYIFDSLLYGSTKGKLIIHCDFQVFVKFVCPDLGSVRRHWK